MNRMTKEEELGVRTIQCLQAMSGIDEPEERALIGWRSMTDEQREETKFVHALAHALNDVQ